MEIKHEFNSALTGLMQYTTNGELYLVNNTVDKLFSKNEMQDIADIYKGVNRLHKPMPLLFWQDCKDGKYSNWDK